MARDYIAWQQKARQSDLALHSTGTHQRAPRGHPLK